MIAAVLTCVLILAIGAISCYLLTTRSGPFAPFSAASSALGLDQAAQVQPASAQAPVTPAAIVNASPASSSPAASTPAVTKPPTTYITINGADMPGSDMPVIGDDGKQTTSQGTYGPSGCTAICSANTGCAASVYQPSTKTCYIKSSFTGSSVTSNADRVLAVAGNPLPGKAQYSTAYDGQDILAPVLPTFGDCSSLCSSMPGCAGVVYDNTYGKACHVKSAMSNQKGNPDTNAWIRTADH